MNDFELLDRLSQVISAFLQDEGFERNGPDDMPLRNDLVIIFRNHFHPDPAHEAADWTQEDEEENEFAHLDEEQLAALVDAEMAEMAGFIVPDDDDEAEEDAEWNSELADAETTETFESQDTTTTEEFSEE